MLMIDFENLKLIEVDDYLTVDIVLDWNPSFLDEKVSVFMDALNRKVENELDKHLLKKNVLFRYITRLENEDLDIITDNLVNAVVNYMVSGPREREGGPRLGIENIPEFSALLMLDGTLTDCINNRLDTDVFNIQILNKYDKEFFCITEAINHVPTPVVEEVEIAAE